MTDQTASEHLAEILHKQGAYCGGCDYESRCPDCDKVLDSYAAAILADGWRPPARVIETREELDTLGFPCVIREEPTHPTEFYPVIWEMGFQTGWCWAGRDFDPDDCTPRLPIRVLWTPENGDTGE